MKIKQERERESENRERVGKKETGERLEGLLHERNLRPNH